MLGLIIGNVDFNGAIIFVALATGATVVITAYISKKKTPEDYDIEKLKIEKSSTKEMTAYRRD